MNKAKEYLKSRTHSGWATRLVHEALKIQKEEIIELINKHRYAKSVDMIITKIKEL